MSLENSFFSKETVDSLIKFCCSHYDQVVVMLPDGPAYHTYRAFGFDEIKSRAKAHRHGNNLRNKVAASLGGLSAAARKRVLCPRWATDVDVCLEYQAQLTRIRALHSCEGSAFSEQVHAASAQVVGRESNPRHIDTALGAECLLQELAFLDALDAILNSGALKGYEPPESFVSVFVYHKPWPVFDFFRMNCASDSSTDGSSCGSCKLSMEVVTAEMLRHHSLSTVPTAAAE